MTAAELTEVEVADDYGETRVLRRRWYMGEPFLQFAYWDGEAWVPASPLFEDGDQLKAYARSLLRACKETVYDEYDVAVRLKTGKKRRTMWE